MKNKEILVEDIWNKQKKESIKKIILQQSGKQSAERILRNELLAIQFKIEDYIKTDSQHTQMVKILDFVKMYLKALKITKKEFAAYLEMQDTNLHKYLTGERKLNVDIVLKLSTFSHTNPEYWYRIQIKNELIELNKEKQNVSNYEKYDYRNLLRA